MSFVFLGNQNEFFAGFRKGLQCNNSESCARALEARHPLDSGSAVSSLRQSGRDTGIVCGPLATAHQVSHANLARRR
jgi:hypothetical protein